jgi:hypothetical protein
MTGRTFGELTVLRKDGNHAAGAAMWLCSCSCGAQTRTKGTDLRLGKALSCGHARDAAFRASTKTHGAARTRLYEIWKNMRRRCGNATNPHYGGKGIGVTDEWGEFDAFRDWALASGYNEQMTIERRDNAKGYSPGNCTWVPHSRQAINRTIVAMRSDGVPWLHVARQNSISDAAYRTRVFDGWDHEQAATWPMFKRRPLP